MSQGHAIAAGDVCDNTTIVRKHASSPDVYGFLSEFLFRYFRDALNVLVDHDLVLPAARWFRRFSGQENDGILVVGHFPSRNERLPQWAPRLNPAWSCWFARNG